MRGEAEPEKGAIAIALISASRGFPEKYEAAIVRAAVWGRAETAAARAADVPPARRGGPVLRGAVRVC